MLFGNVSVAALAFSGLMHSPMFVGRQRMQLSNSNFDKFDFSVMMRSGSAFIQASTFSNGLNAALVFNGAEYKDLTNKRVSANTANDEVKVLKCVFSGMSYISSGAGVSAQGAGITLEVDSCSFHKCNAVISGGGLYANVASSIVEGSCFDECVAASSSAFYASVDAGKNNELYHSTVTRCTGTETQNQVNGHIAVTLTNISSNSAISNSGVLVSTSETIDVSKTTIELNTRGSHCTLSGFPVEIQFEKNNFFNNTGANLVKVSKDTTFSKIRIVKNNPLIYVFNFEGKKVILADCEVDVPKSTMGSLVVGDDSQFGKSDVSTHNYIYLEKYGCKTTGTLFSTLEWILIGAGGVVALVIIIWIVVCVCKRKKRDSK